MKMKFKADKQDNENLWERKASKEDLDNAITGIINSIDFT